MLDDESRTARPGPACTLAAAAVLSLTAGCAAQAPGCDQGQVNRRLVSDFVHRFYDQRDVRGAFERYVAPDYVQHNPNIADGREAAIVALTPLFANREVQLQVRHVIVDGDMVVVHLLARENPAARGAAVADIFRISGGRIVEHWDILEDIPEHSLNPHPMF